MNFWDKLADFLTRNRRIALGCGLIFAALLALPLARLDVSTDIFELMPDNLPTVRAFREYDANFSQGDDLTVALEVPDSTPPETLAAVLPAFAAALERVDEVAAVQFRLPSLTDGAALADFLDNFYLFLDDESLAQLQNRLSPDGIRAQISRNRQLLHASPSPLVAERIARDPLGISEIARAHFQKFSRSRDGEAAAPDAGGGRFGSPDGRLRLLQVSARGDTRDAHYCERLVRNARAAVEQTRAQLPPEIGEQIRVGITGRAAYAAEIAQHLRRDMLLTAAGSLTLVMLVFWFGFRRLWPLGAMGLTLVLVVVSALGLAAIAFGKLNIITAVFAAILIGLGVDYGILLYNYFALRRDGPPNEALAASFRANGRGILAGAFTTAAAFATILLARPPAFKQFGLLTSLGILLCAAWMLLFFASLIATRRTELKTARVTAFLERLAGKISRRPRVFFAAAIVFSIIALTFLLGVGHAGVGIDADPASLRFRSSEAQATLERIFAKTGRKSSPLLVLQRGQNVSELAEKTRELRTRLEPLLAENRILRFESPAVFLASERQQRENLEALAQLDFGKIRENFTENLRENGFGPQQFGAAFAWLDSLERKTRAVSDAALAPAAFFRALPHWKSLLARAVNADFTQSATYIYPAEPLRTARDLNEWRESLGVDDVRRKLTGWDEMIAEMQTQLRVDFSEILGITALLVLACLGVIYRRAALVGLALVPLFFGMIFLLATMKLCGVQFNLANFFALPLVVGCGIDYGIHIVNAWKHQRGDVPSLMRTTGRAIVMNALTTSFGFGSLMLADHVGLTSLGFVVGFGILWVMASALIVLPAALAMRRPSPT
jgi:predicted RND superfamily exporter protein